MQINAVVLVNKTYINQSTLSAKLGFSETIYRKWITEFQEFIPPQIVGESNMYDNNNALDSKKLFLHLLSYRKQLKK